MRDRKEDFTKYKPNADGKLWSKIRKTRDNPKALRLPAYDERIWISKLNKKCKSILSKGFKVVRLHINDPAITPIERIKLKTFFHFSSQIHAQNTLTVCMNDRGELAIAGKEAIIEESHGSLASQHFGENKSILLFNFQDESTLGHTLDHSHYLRKHPFLLFGKHRNPSGKPRTRTTVETIRLD